MFVAREEELNLLNALLTQKSSSLVVVYGRRRIGKTETVRHFIRENDLTSIEITGVFGATKTTQLKSFARKISRASKGTVSIDRGLKEWQDGFFMLEDHLDSLTADKKVIFLDELPWLDTHRSGFLSAFSQFWNDYCTRREDILLIVCGSATSYMINKIVKNKKTLHNRVTHKINMMPFKLQATKSLLEAKGCRYTNKSIVDIYCAFGGVAKYIQDIDPSKHPVENIDFHCFDKNGILVSEYQELYESLFKNYQWHYRIMTFLSTRWCGAIQKDIAIKLNTSSSVIKVFLEELELSGFISSTTSLGKKTREKIYRATDPFSYFYNKWMKSNKNISWKRTVSSQSYKAWSGFAFENICHIHMDEIKGAMGISGISTKSHYWRYVGGANGDKGAQIDMILEHTDGSNNIDIIECKYHDQKFTITKAYLDELKNKLSIFNEQTHSKYNIQLVFVSMFGLVKNEYYHEIVNREVLMDDILR